MFSYVYSGSDKGLYEWGTFQHVNDCSPHEIDELGFFSGVIDIYAGV